MVSGRKGGSLLLAFGPHTLLRELLKSEIRLVMRRMSGSACTWSVLSGVRSCMGKAYWSARLKSQCILQTNVIGDFTKLTKMSITGGPVKDQC